MVELYLEELVDRVATPRKRPVLVYLAARGGEGMHEALNLLFLDRQVIRTLAAQFVYRVYERGTFVGDAAAARLGYALHDPYPVLIVLTPNGDIHMKWVIAGPEYLYRVGPGQFNYYLTLWANEALKSNAEVIEAARQFPEDQSVTKLAAQRSWAAGDTHEAIRWLTTVAEKPQGAVDGATAQTMWKVALLELSQSFSETGKRIAREYLRQFPLHGMAAARLLALSGAELSEVEAAINSVIETARSDVGADDRSVRVDFNSIAYDSLRLGALDAALSASQTQVQSDAGNPNALDTLAHVQAARAEYQSAVNTARRGLELVSEDSRMAETLRQTLLIARSGASPSIKTLSRADLLKRLLKAPGDNPLFPPQDPDDLVRAEIESPIAELVRSCLKDAESTEFVVEVRLNISGQLELQFIYPPVSQEQEDCFRRGLARITSPAGFASMVVTLTVAV